MRNMLFTWLAATVVMSVAVPAAQAAKGVKKLGGIAVVRGQLSGVQVQPPGNTGSIMVRTATSHRKLGIGGGGVTGGLGRVFQVTPKTSITATNGYQQTPVSLAVLRQGLHVRVFAQNQVANSVQVLSLSQHHSYGSFHRHYRPTYVAGRHHYPKHMNTSGVAHTTTGKTATPGMMGKTTPSSTAKTPHTTAAKTTTPTNHAATTMTHHATPNATHHVKPATPAASHIAMSQHAAQVHHAAPVHNSPPLVHSAPAHSAPAHHAPAHPGGKR